jgi:hypothetical protein
MMTFEYFGVARALVLRAGLLALLAACTQSAMAALERTGPVDPANGFPAWYQDTTGVAFEFGSPLSQEELDGGWLLLLPADVPTGTAPESFPANFAGEHFYWAGEAGIDYGLPGGGASRALLVLGVEATFAAEDPVPGDQVAFGRLRIRINELPYNGTYTVHTPYGVFTFPDQVAGERLFYTADIGLEDRFDGPLHSHLGPFLLPSATPGGAELPPVTGPVQGKLYISEPGRVGPVTGCLPPNQNRFRIEGPNGFVIQTFDFAVSGRLFTGQIPGRVDVERAVYTRTAEQQRVDVFATVAPTRPVRLPGAPVPPPVMPVLTYFNAPPDTDTVTGELTAPAGFAAQPMSNSGASYWGQSFPDALPAAVTLQDESARNADGTVLPAYFTAPVTDEVLVETASFDPDGTGLLLVRAQSSDAVAPPVLTLEGAGELTNGQILLAPNDVPSGRVTVRSSRGGSDSRNVTTGYRFVPAQAISNIEDLQRIGHDAAYPLHGAYWLTRDIDASATASWNDADSDESLLEGFSPIGVAGELLEASQTWTNAIPFKGVLDGKGYAVRTLTVNRPSQVGVGLFGSLGAAATVTNLTLDACAVVGAKAVGGLAGVSYGTVSDSDETGAVEGLGDVGGLIGRMESGSLNRCSATGAVSGVSAAAGGLVGRVVSGTVRACYATGSAAADTAVGGLVGSNAGALDTCYAAVTVTGSGLTGGLVGEGLSGTVANAYWDLPVSGQTASAGGDGKTATQMRQQATYAGWAFGREWKIDEGVSYPELLKGVCFSQSRIAVAEDAGTVTLTVNRGLETGAASLTVYLQAGTATAADYAPPAGNPVTVAWAEGEFTPKTVVVPIKTDRLIEGDETFYALLGRAVNCTFEEPVICQVTIKDANRNDSLADALDNVLLTWATGGAARWVPQGAVTFDGEDAAVSGAMAANALGNVRTSVRGAGTLSFAWSVVGQGTLRLYDGATVLATVPADTAWESRTLELTQTGAHALKWEFAQGGDAASRAYLDQVVWLPAGKAGVAVTARASHPVAGTVTGTGVYYAGAKVPLSAKPRPGWLFTGWTPAELFRNPSATRQTLTLGDSPVEATANFAKVPVVVGLPQPPEGGTVAGAGLCPPGRSVTLRATAAQGWAFTRWSDGVQTASHAVAAVQDVTLYAEFRLLSLIAPPVIANAGTASAMVGVPFSMPVQVLSETLPTVRVTGLPAGLKFDAAARVISGVPTSVPRGGIATVRIAASNVRGSAAEALIPITVVPLAARAQGTFDGVALEAADADTDAVKGLFTLTVAASGRMTAKATVQAGNYSFKSASWSAESNGVFYATLRTTRGETVSLALDTAATWNTAALQGTLTGGAFGAGEFLMQGQRNAFLGAGSPDHAAATGALAGFKGYYTVALPALGPIEVNGAAGNEPLGSGYLTMTIKAGGTVALAGKLADGTAVSGSAKLMVLGVRAYVPLFFPLNGGRGVFSGLLEIAPAVDAGPEDNVIVPADGFLQLWRYPGKAPTQTEDRFGLSVGLRGGYYGPLASLATYYGTAAFTAQAPGVDYAYVSGAYSTTAEPVLAALPNVPLVFNARTGAVSLPAGGLPVNTGGAYVYAPENPAAATLAANRTTGLFSGRFNLYYEYLDQTGTLRLKTVAVSHAGVLTLLDADGAVPAGEGFYLVPDTWKSPDARPVTYPLKRSYKVEIR